MVELPNGGCCAVVNPRRLPIRNAALYDRPTGIGSGAYLRHLLLGVDFRTDRRRRVVRHRRRLGLRHPTLCHRVPRVAFASRSPAVEAREAVQQLPETKDTPHDADAAGRGRRLNHGRKVLYR
jgi:hypothetical protein